MSCPSSWMVRLMVDLRIDLEVSGDASLSVDVTDSVIIEGIEVSHPIPVIPSNYGLITYNGVSITVS